MLSWTNLRWFLSSVAVRRIVGQPGRPHLYFLPACRSMCCRRACLQYITCITAEDTVFHFPSYTAALSYIKYIFQIYKFSLLIKNLYLYDINKKKRKQRKWSLNIRSKITHPQLRKFDEFKKKSQKKMRWESHYQYFLFLSLTISI